MKLLWCVLWGASLAANFAAEDTIRVESSEEDLEDVIVSVPLTDGEIASGIPMAGTLTSASGEPVVFQRTAVGEMTFVLPRIGRQSVKRYAITTSLPRVDGMFADLEDGKITVVDWGRKVFTYQGEESKLPRPNIDPLFKRGGYIHPVFSPSGRLVTDDYPANHVHHHGIWFPWTKTEFEGRSPDFWNMGQGKGKVEFVRFGRRWSGPVHAGFEAEHRFVDMTTPEPKTALNERWTVTAYHVPGANYFVFDLVSTQTCATASPLKLPQYFYGGLGIRGNWGWNGREKTEFLTSNGETDRVKGNETRGEWCHMGGEVEGAYAGITVFCHPENFRAPQPMRLHPTEPFFCYAPSQVGDWQIEQSKPYVSRYRFVVSDGRPDQSQLQKMWRAYAHPPRVTVEKR